MTEHAAGELTGYLAPEEHVERVVAELDRVVGTHGRLVLARGPAQRSFWALNVWHDVMRFEFDSIGDAARVLRDQQRNWWPYAYQLHRRTELLRQKLPHVKGKPLAFPESAPTAPLGSFVLLDEHTLLCAARCSSPFPNGEPAFVRLSEDEGPTSRAYLKLFEALTRLGEHPVAGQRCIDLGACPGGWTWVLASQGAEVLAVDRSPLDPRVAAMPTVSERLGDAFAVTPERDGPVDWLCSDVICYPSKLLGLVRRWLDAGACKRVVCTLKFQGDEGYGAAEEFAALPGATVTHLFHNKHELTCMVRVP